MKYTDKVKASKGLLEAIKALGDNEYIRVTYGTDYNGQPRQYRINVLYGRVLDHLIVYIRMISLLLMV